MKICSKCKQELPLEAFSKNRNKKDNRQSYCKKCMSEYAVQYCKDNPKKRAAGLARWEENNREKRREQKVQYNKNNRERLSKYYRDNRERIMTCSIQSSRKRKYNMTQEQYENLLEEQNGVCAICQLGCNRALSVDHCHQTGEVRGLLCRKCNSGLGHFNDDPKLIEKALDYLKGEI